LRERNMRGKKEEKKRRKDYVRKKVLEEMKT
jgi:hypothetical protein